jgi:SOS response regulatory protein OraA/RecX
VRRGKPDPDALTPPAARALVLRWLGQRELTAAQVRRRLRQRHFPASVIDTTLTALSADGSLDDVRAAAARARHDLAIKRRGPGRILRDLEAMGVERDAARHAVAAAFADADQDALLEAALERRLRGGPFPTEPKAAARLAAWLVRQGHDADRVAARMRRRHV